MLRLCDDLSVGKEIACCLIYICCDNGVDGENSAPENSAPISQLGGK